MNCILLVKKNSLYAVLPPDPKVVSNKIIVSNKLLGLLSGLLGQGSFYVREIAILISYWNC